MTTLNLNNSNQFLYLKDINDEDPFIYVIYKDRVKDIPTNETYDRFGQSIPNDNAGDYSVYNHYTDAREICLQEVLKKFNITSLKNGYSDPLKVDFLKIENGFIQIMGNIDDDDIENYDEDLIDKFIQEWEKENGDYTMSRGFNYWDGGNNRSVILSSDNDDGITHEELTGSDVPNIDFENMEHLRDGFGTEIYQYEDWYIINSHCQGAWENYKVIRKSEIEEDQL